MFRPVIDFGRQVLGLKQQTESNTAAIDQIRLEQKEMADAIRWLANELERTKDNERHEREKLLLRLELLLRSEGRSYPTTLLTDSTKDDEIAALRRENVTLRERLADLESRSDRGPQ